MPWNAPNCVGGMDDSHCRIKDVEDLAIDLAPLWRFCGAIADELGRSPFEKIVLPSDSLASMAHVHPLP